MPHRYDAARAGDRAAYMFKLHRSVVNMEAVSQYFVYILQDAVT